MRPPVAVALAASLVVFGHAARAQTPERAIGAAVLRPMLLVARLITQEKFSPHIDEMLANSRSARRLGRGWTRENPAWSSARQVVVARIDKLADAYGGSPEFDQMLKAEIRRVAAGETAAALARTLAGPSGAAILRAQAQIQFVSTVMADDPDAPSIGDPARRDRMRVLTGSFSEHASGALPADPAHVADVSEFFSTPEAAMLRQLWNGVVGKATVRLDAAVNLLLFDDSAAIAREVDAVIASAR